MFYQGIKLLQFLTHASEPLYNAFRITEDFKINPGAVEAIAEQPENPDNILIGYNRGLMVLWNRETSSVEQVNIKKKETSLFKLSLNVFVSRFILYYKLFHSRPSSAAKILKAFAGMRVEQNLPLLTMMEAMPFLMYPKAQTLPRTLYLHMDLSLVKQ